MALDPTTLAGIGGGLDFFNTWYTNRQNQKNSREQREWEKYMYQNRYQMQVADLMAAGLNPMLAYQQSPGSVPTGSTAQAQKPDTVRAMNETRIASAQEANINSNTQKMIAEKNNIDADTLAKNEMPALIRQQVIQASNSAQQSAELAKQIRASIPKIEWEIKELEQRIKTEKSNVKLNQSLIDANIWLNGLRAAEKFLTNARTKNEELTGEILKREKTILDPKARAAQTHGAEAGAYMEQSMGKILKSIVPLSK